MRGKIAVALATAAVAGLVAAPASNADEPGCQSGPFLYGLRMSTRLICDEPVQPDGSWLRHRGFFADPYYKSVCYTYWCEGRVVPELKVIDHYRVTPDTVLPDEPPHIPGG